MDTTAAHDVTRTRPPVGRWVIDPGHAEVAFVGRHLMLTKVRGRFTGVAGTIVVVDRREDSRVEATIDVGSVDSGDATRDDHLRSSDLFDVARYPTATFRASGLRLEGPRGQMEGELTLRGVTRPVALAVEYAGHVVDPWGGERLVFSAAGRVDREDWGLTWNMPLDAGGLLVSREVDIEINLEAVPETAEP